MVSYEHEEGKGGGKEKMNFGITVRKLKEEYMNLSKTNKLGSHCLLDYNYVLFQKIANLDYDPSLLFEHKLKSCPRIKRGVQPKSLLLLTLFLTPFTLRNSRNPSTPFAT